MECPTKSMTSYQRLKWELEETFKDLKREREKAKIFENALWTIANMKGAQVVEAPKTALQALTKTNETK